jgi:pimeloyl-ACP methyl ester carboxylesterase
VQHIAAGGVSMGGVATVMGAAAEPRIGPLIVESSSYRSQRVFDFMLEQFRIPDGGPRWGFSSLLNSVGVWRMGGEWADVREGKLPTWRLAPKMAPRPVLFIYGDRDPLVQKEDIALFRTRFTGPTRVLVARDTGHGVYRPHQAAYSKVVMEFLDSWRSGTNSNVGTQSAAEQALPGV